MSSTRRRWRGTKADCRRRDAEARARLPNTLEVSALPDKGTSDAAAKFTVEGTVLHDGSPRVLQINGYPWNRSLGHDSVFAEPG